MAEQQMIVAVQTVERPLNLVPVGLKEAALDSPTFRATALHFTDQIDIVERWLEGYAKSAAKLAAEVTTLETVVNSFISQCLPSSQISEAVLDHDYVILAMRRYNEGAREFWNNTLRSVKRYDTTVVDPIKGFLNFELKTFKDTRRAMDSAQRNFDGVISRYLGQSKGKEASSLREDAFQLHQARKEYLKTSMEFCVQAPQLRASLDKLVVKIFAEQWKDMRTSREANATTFARWGNEMERVKGWSREMENSERAFKRELLAARQQLESSAEQMTRPSRELDDYAASTVPYLGTGPSAAPTSGKGNREKSERQGWLFLKTITGKPARTLWSRRWFFVKNGIFGWLAQGLRSGGVEESEKTGVLLCSVRPAFQEERRFCFEVKTKDTSIILQAETQQELTEWISAFEMAKRKALEDPASTEATPQSSSIDPAFAITPPVSPEFAAKVGEGHAHTGSEDASASLGVPDGSGMPTRPSFDVTGNRRVMSTERENEGTRDHAARIIQKLDLTKRSAASTQQNTAPSAGGIASLISASHHVLPVGPGVSPPASDGPKRTFSMPHSSLAPSTLANPPAATSLSNTAVVVSSERGIGLGRADSTGTPSGILANLWGSSVWGYVNRLGDTVASPKPVTGPAAPRPSAPTASQDDSIILDGMTDSPKQLDNLGVEPLSTSLHRKTMSIGTQPTASPVTAAAENAVDEYPNYYPMALKAQNAQFRMLFPVVPRAEKVVLVFRATWNPNEQQEFPGRVYVTTKEVYFYSNHLGLVLITGVSLCNINDVTAAPGRDCDFLYLHLKDSNGQGEFRRITIKVFLEQLRLLQRRLNYLVSNARDGQPSSLEETIKALIKMEVEEPKRSSSVESWEDVTYDGNEATNASNTQGRRERNVKASLRIDGSLYGDTARTGREIQRFKLPAQPVRYAPQGMQASISRDFSVSAKALFHVMFGDKSAVFQLLYCNRWGDKIVQTPWVKPDGGHWTRQFSSQNDATPMADTQTVDILNDHLCYVVTNDRQPWRLPYANSYSLTTKFVITHSAKSRCKLAIFQKLLWHSPPRLPYIRRLIERQALNSLEADAIDLGTVAHDQVAKLGSHSKTNKAIEIFGNIGQHDKAAQIDTSQGRVGGALRVGQTKPVSLFNLVLHDVLNQMLAVISIGIDVTVALGKAVASVCTAHTFLVVFLLVSAVYNGWYGYRDGLLWYQDRTASKFMARVGVTPDTRLTKSLYLNDIEELVVSTLENDTVSALSSQAPTTGKTCRSTFGEQLLISTSRPAASTTGARLHRSRDALARQRHDLLVAMRVLNRVEKDIMLAEWEEWVRSEERQCEQVENLLRGQHERDKKGSRSASQLGAAELDSELGSDFVEYCDSCRNEARELENGVSLI